MILKQNGIVKHSLEDGTFSGNCKIPVAKLIFRTSNVSKALLSISISTETLVWGSKQNVHLGVM